MSLTFEVSVHGEKLVSRRILRLEHQALHAKPAFEAIGESLLRRERKLFATEGASGGQAWAPLAAATIRAKAGKGQDPRILRATGALHSSLTDRTDSRNLFDADDDGIVFGSRLPYARYHQHGTRRMPQRRPLQLKEQQKRDVLRILQRFLMQLESDAQALV
ncbi:MAG: phage virion morphogenesis protein [Chloroflexi bacterium]|nr:phage virion morphogenesis protein [Chloroflexota bacterium]